MELEALIVPLKLDSSAYEKGLKSSEKKTTSFSKKMEKLGKSAVKVGGIMSAAITAPIIGGMAAAISKTQDWTDTVDSLGDVLGTSAKDSSALAFAIQRVGGDVNSLGGQMAFLTKGLADANGELGPTGKKLEELGISFRDANGNMLPTTDILSAVATKINSMPDGLDKTRLMMDIFGKSGKDLSDTMAALADDGLDKAREATEKYGLALSDEDVQKNLEFGKSVEEMKLAFDGLLVTLGTNLLPAITPVIKELTDKLPLLIDKLREWKEKFDALPEPIQNVLIKLATLSVVLGPLLVLAGKLSPGLVAIGGALSKLPGLLLFIVNGIAALLVAFGLLNIGGLSLTDFFKVILIPTIKDVLTGTGDLRAGLSMLGVLFKILVTPLIILTSLLIGFIGWLKIGKAASNLGRKAWESDWLGIKTAVQKAFVSIILWIDKFVKKVPEITNIIKEGVQPTLDGLGRVFDRVFSGAINGINNVIGSIGSLISSFSNIKLPKWLTPGSPTPFEKGLDGIYTAMKKIDRLSSSDFGFNFGGISPSAGMSGLEPATQTVLQLDYHPMFSMADRKELEYNLKPMIESVLRGT